MDIENLDFDGKLWITPEVIGNASQCGTHIAESVQCQKNNFKKIEIFFRFSAHVGGYTVKLKRKNFFIF